MASQPLAALGLLLTASLLVAGADATSLEIRHRFSDRMREWAEAHGVAGMRWPQKGTVEYYASLARHDRALRGRSLASNFSELALADGNATFLEKNLEFLYYAVVALGTPKKHFLVALNTENGWFWVPCDCLQCAPTSNPIKYGQNVTFNVYSPTNSSTSRSVLCSDSICGNTCAGSNATCPYSVDYLYVNTSSSGTLVSDTLYLVTDDATQQPVKAPVVFGCGRNQSGALLDTFAPNGVLGLGLGEMAVPSVLAAAGLVPDSFSLCFGADGVGRLDFGDRGGAGQPRTPLNMDGSSFYNISFTGIAVGNRSTAASFTAIVDSGVAFTYLSDPTYSTLTDSFHAQVQDTPHKPDPNLPFEYCYDVSGSTQSPNIPSVDLTTAGGSNFPVNYPLILVQGTTYCLAVVKNDGFNLIGQNFLEGLRVVFDRERLNFGWEKSDCYQASNSVPVPASAPAPAPAPAADSSPASSPDLPPDIEAPAASPPRSGAWRLSNMRRSFLLIILPLLTMAML
ncbi:unnamed protein product [Musa hybrid cultivar]